jgi:small-conductance mechanosensitive channel
MALPLPEGEVVLQAAATGAIGVVVAVIGSLLVGAALKRVTSPERAALGRRVVLWAGVGLAMAGALRVLGIDMSFLLGAAGVLTVALGFASQTSASNLISGLFLIAERPFSVGEVVTIGATTGEVLSVDFLSVKLRTFENLYVRVPNETVMKAEIQNRSRYPIRRCEVRVTLPLGSDYDVLERELIAVADALPDVLDEPRPSIQFVELSDAGVVVRILAWAEGDSVARVRKDLAYAALDHLERIGARPPAPRRQQGS